MNYLVDTHILLWSFLETSKLSKTVKLILLDENNDIFYSPINLWEISIKYGLKKLFLNGGTPDDFFDELNNSYFHSKAIDAMDLMTNYKLPIGSYKMGKQPSNSEKTTPQILNRHIVLSILFTPPIYSIFPQIFLKKGDCHENEQNRIGMSYGRHDHKHDADCLRMSDRGHW